MPKLFYDRIKETTTSTSTGDITLLGPVTQYIAFSTRFALEQPFYYCIVGQTGTEWETGKGTLSSSSTLVRTYVLESSNSDALVNFSAGTKDVFVTIPGKCMNEMSTKGKILANLTGNALP